MTTDDLKLTEAHFEGPREEKLRKIRRVPKSDCHAHLLLSAPFDFVNGRLGGILPKPPARFVSLNDFLSHLKQFYWPHYGSLSFVESVFDAAIEHMIADGVAYAEVSIDTALGLVTGVTWPELGARFKERLDRFGTRIEIRAELGLSRDFTHPDAPALAKAAMRTGIFRSVDLYGAEDFQPVENYRWFFDAARDIGLKTKLHCGESCSGENMLREVRLVRPDAVQHGTRAVEDPRAVAWLVENGVSAHICPWSNYLLSVCERYEDHPIRKLFDAGVRVTINSDDYTVFGRSVSEEYLALHDGGVFDAAELEQIRRNGFEWSTRHI